jgi:hypothetical protein
MIVRFLLPIVLEKIGQNPTLSPTFSNAYPNASFQVIHRDNYLPFLQI